MFIKLYVWWWVCCVSSKAFRDGNLGPVLYSCLVQRVKMYTRWVLIFYICLFTKDYFSLDSNVKVTIRPGLSRTVLYFWVLSWISQRPGFVLDLKSSDPSLENVYLSQYYVLTVRLLTTAHYLKHPAGWKTAQNLVSWFSAKSLKLLPPVVRFQG